VLQRKLSYEERIQQIAKEARLEKIFAYEILTKEVITSKISE
jgi:hypothetical protein